MSYHPSAHQPERPVWDCRECGESWPCATRRAELHAELGPVALTIFMIGYWIDATNDLPDAASGELRQQFLGWVRD